MAQCDIKSLKNDHFLRIMLDILPKKHFLQLVKYNKKMKKRLDLTINVYKEYCETYSLIEIEIIPKKKGKGKFININKEDKQYYHIYFNDNKEEVKRYNINEDDNVTKINIRINYQILSFKDLFYKCECIGSINFKKFYRNNINNMREMFYECSSLKEINLSNFNTNNVTNMNCMFSGCSDEIKMMVKSQVKNIKQEAFEDYDDDLIKKLLNIKRINDFKS